MTENKSKRKDIVKNVAIVFLAVLLGLTFFSNTIMNWSLPEVSGQYAGYGTITSSIRASGTVAANQGYSVTIAETREIKNVLIRKGDKVEAGQVIFTLEEGDSSELEAAREELDNMEYQYKLALINSGDNSYSGLELDLAELKEDLADAQKKLDGLQEYSDTEGIEAALEEAQKGVKACEEHIAELEKQRDGLGDKEDADDETIRAAMNTRDAAKVADELAKETYEELLAFQTDLENAQNAVDTTEKKLNQLLVDQAKAEQDYAYKHPMVEAYRSARVRLINAQSRVSDWYGTTAQQDADPVGYASALQELKDAEAAISVLTEVSKEEVEKLSEQLIVFKDDIFYTTRELEEAKAMLEVCNPDNRELSDVKLEVARAKMRTRETASALAEAQRALDRVTGGVKENLQQRIREAKNELEEAQSVLKDAEALQVKNQDYQNAVKAVEQLEKSIQSKNREIENAKKQGSAEQQRKYLELQRQQEAIEKQKQVVEKLEAKRTGTDVTAKYAGEVISVNVLAGDKVTPDTTLAQIGVEGKGYTMLVTVTNEQSRRLNVGDQAKVNNYWWGNISLTLTAIRTDRSNPGQNKVLEFNVEGDVVDGQTLEITIGERSNSYNLVVPNSAVREDTNGKFILVAEAKSTPLGNRYTAVRVDVTVLEKDNYNTALDAGTDFGYQYVITTSTKPLEAGMLVRLAEN